MKIMNQTPLTVINVDETIKIVIAPALYDKWDDKKHAEIQASIEALKSAGRHLRNGLGETEDLQKTCLDILIEDAKDMGLAAKEELTNKGHKSIDEICIEVLENETFVKTWIIYGTKFPII